MMVDEAKADEAKTEAKKAPKAPRRKPVAKQASLLDCNNQFKDTERAAADRRAEIRAKVEEALRD